MIYVVEDDPGIRELECYALKQAGFEARGFEEGEAFLEAVRVQLPQLVLLDVMLPGEDGVAVLEKLHSNAPWSDIPVIMATARGMEYDKIQCLDLGADDYLVKPFGMMEMVSRVRAVLRRCQKARSDTVLHAGNVCLNTDQRTVTADGEEVRLTYKEFEVLKLFMEHPGTVFTRDRLFGEVWGEDFVGETRTVDMHIRTLRQKLGESGAMIETVRNVGYRMSVRP